jgi:hypothetical protein
MPVYSVFGGYFSSEVTFPELREVAAPAPTWTLRIVDALPEASELTLLGVHQASVRTASTYKWPGGFRIVYSDENGTYDVSRDGSQITWLPGSGADVELARMAILGRVLPTALHAAGTLCLHGSAVALDQGGIAFLAPKLHGKSTLALALATAGARLLTDDTLPVEPGSPVTVGPGVHSVRLWSDSAERFLGERILGETVASNRAPAGKHIFNELPKNRVALDRVPLLAVYLLRPVASLPDGAAVRRTPVAPVPAAMSIVTQLKVGAVLGGTESALSFDRAVRVAGSVPVYTLNVVRDFDRMPEVVGQIMEWHDHPVMSLQDAVAPAP